MQNVIIGTAGHIDHGKTTLIKALTGRNTDTLKDEINRGITINLGFTYFDLPGGKRAGIVDVPGHERFIKNMLAGVSGIDIALLVIAANEGIKPQTAEHMDILSFLNLDHGLIVLTKYDLADELMRELVIDDIQEKVSGTVFEKWDIVPVDSVSGYGIEELVKKLDMLAGTPGGKNINAPARLNIDRVFSVKGFGTIVTGTLTEGKMSVDDEMMIYPGNLTVKVRNIQVHEQNVSAAYAGQRVAVNLSGVRRADTGRGDVLAAPGSVRETAVLDVRLSLTKWCEWELKPWDRVRLHLGCREVFARVAPYDMKTMKANDTGYCRLRLEEGLFVKKGDRFVIRSYSPMETIGGGIILDANPGNPETSLRAGTRAVRLETLKGMDNGGDKALIESFIRDSRNSYINLNDVSNHMSGDLAAAQAVVKELLDEGRILSVNDVYFHMDTINMMREGIAGILEKYHERYRLRAGMPKEELRSKLGTGIKIKEFDALCKIFESEGIIKAAAPGYMALRGFEPRYDGVRKKIKDEIETTLLETGYTPPSASELTKNSSKEYTEVLESLLSSSVVRLDAQTVMHRKHYEAAQDIVVGFITQNGSITVAELRDLLSSSRKYTVALLDAFDSIKLTERVEDKRVLVKTNKGE